MFQFTGTCIVRHVKTDRAKSADAPAKAKVHITLPTMDHESAAGVLLGQSENILASFFDVHEEGLPIAFKGCTLIKAGNTWEDSHTLKIGQLRKVNARRLRVLSVKPQDGGTFETEVEILFERLPDNFVEQLGEICNRESGLVVTQIVEDPPEQVDAFPNDKKPAGKQDDAFKESGKKAEGKKASGTKQKSKKPAKPRSRSKKKTPTATTETVPAGSTVN